MYINMRLEMILKKRKALQKFTKSDIAAEFLKCGRDYNAYERAKELLLQQNMLSCYELIGKFIGCISDHLYDLCKQRDCPDECKETVPSLMYAAARFADLPELRELRTLFTENYGNSLEPYISKEFVEKLRQNLPTKEMKIRLLYDIAQEFSIDWDGKAFEQRLYTPPSLHEGRHKDGPLNDFDGEEWHGNNDVAIHKTDKLVTGGKPTEGRDCNTSEGNERDTISQGRKDINDDSWRHQSSSDDETSTDMSSLDGRKTRSSSLGSFSENEEETKRPFFYRLVPPPYLKQKGESNLKKTTDSASASPTEKKTNHDLHEPVDQEKPIPRSVKRIPLKPLPGHDTVSHYKTDGAARTDSGGKKSDTGKGKAYPSERPEYDTGQNRKHTRSYERRTSLPSEPTTSVETLRGQAQANSLETEKRGGAGRVHPNLPDYDDLVAYLAALRGR